MCFSGLFEWFTNLQKLRFNNLFYKFHSQFIPNFTAYIAEKKMFPLQKKNILIGIEMFLFLHHSLNKLLQIICVTSKETRTSFMHLMPITFLTIKKTQFNIQLSLIVKKRL